MSFIRYRVIISPPKSIDPYIINFYKTDRKYRFWKIRYIIYPAFFIQWISLTFIKTESTTGNSSNSIYKSVNTNKSMRLSFIIHIGYPSNRIFIRIYNECFPAQHSLLLPNIIYYCCFWPATSRDQIFIILNMCYLGPIFFKFT